MLDDFRQQASSSSLFDEEETGYARPERRPAARFLGLTASQRFVIAVMVLLITCILGTFCLLVTGRVVLPFV